MINRHRGIGWEYLHVAVDDASRLAYTEILPDERKASAIAFLERALAWFARHGVAVERIMTDNGNAYRSLCSSGRAASAHQAVHAAHPRQGRALPPDGHARMRLCPRLPVVPGAAVALPRWLHVYNAHRPHTARARNPQSPGSP